MGYRWQLRHRMAEQGMFQTSDLVPRLAERGVVLSREQVYRLVTRPPQRLSIDILVALCDILDCTPNDLIKPEVVNTPVRKPSGGGDAGPAPVPPRRSVVRRPGGHELTGDRTGASVGLGGCPASARRRRPRSSGRDDGRRSTAVSRPAGLVAVGRLGDDAFRAQRRLVSRALQIRNACEFLRTCAILWS